MQTYFLLLGDIFAKYDPKFFIKDSMDRQQAFLHLMIFLLFFEGLISAGEKPNQTVSLFFLYRELAFDTFSKVQK
jgi:hypothetical protein